MRICSNGSLARSLNNWISTACAIGLKYSTGVVTLPSNTVLDRITSSLLNVSPPTMSTRPPASSTSSIFCVMAARSNSLSFNRLALSSQPPINESINNKKKAFLCIF